MFVAGVVFLLGAILTGVANSIVLLIIGRLLFGVGVGVGFANQAIPVYLSEMAPAEIRGALNIGFSMAITIGILVANLVNYCTSKIKGGYGWRVSLALAAVPALMMTAGAIFLPDTPNSILERGHPQKAKKMLQKLRGTDNVDEEFQDLIEASEASKRMEHAWKNITFLRYRPQLVICILIPFFQQLTGINIIMFYAPVLFKTLGMGDDASLISAVITGCVNVLATLISVLTVDRFGRRVLFLEGGVQMIICQIGVAVIIGLKYGVSGVGSISKGEADIVLIFICIYVMGFAWSWGALGCFSIHALPHEVWSLHFFAAFVTLMSLFIAFFMPETKNVPIEEINTVWKAHWFWGKYIPDDAVINGTHRRAVV
ncbi:hypothetical protein ACLB2K_012011 [Fragaria x ananassa]